MSYSVCPPTRGRPSDSHSRRRRWSSLERPWPGGKGTDSAGGVTVQLLKVDGSPERPGVDHHAVAPSVRGAVWGAVGPWLDMSMFVGSPPPWLTHTGDGRVCLVYRASC